MTIDKILALGQTAMELGLINSLTVLSLFLSYSMLNVCDLSTDGCYTLGAAVGALVAIAGYPWLSLPAAMLAGMISGFVTATLQTRMGVQSLLAGIVVNTALYSVNMALTGNKATLAMNKTTTIFSMAKNLLKGTPLAGQSTLIVMLVIVALAIRATGSNADMVRSSSINPTFTTTVGLCVSNAFTGLSGCLMAQQAKSFDINMGSGMVTVALASLLIGGVFVAKHKLIPLRAVGAVLGAVLFRIVYALALRFNMPAFMLKAVSSIIVVLAISGPYLRQQLPLMIRRWKASREGRNA